MEPPSGNDEKLAQVVHRTLRELPPRRAPHSLEQRVLAEIGRRASRPWWQKNFKYWPATARAVFIVLCAVIVRLAFMGSAWGMTGFDPAQFKEIFAEPVRVMDNGLLVIHAVTGFFNIMLRNIPAPWLYGGLVFFASMYAALFGLGAAAFRALRTQR